MRTKMKTKVNKSKSDIRSVYEKLYRLHAEEKYAERCKKADMDSFFFLDNSTINEVKMDGSHAEVMIVGPFDEFFGVDVRDTIKALNKSNPQSIHLVLNSPGGLFWQGHTLYHDLVGRIRGGVEVTTEGRGLVASAAVMPYLAGSERSLSESTLVMLHRPSAFAFCEGDADRLEKEVGKQVSAMRKVESTMNTLFKSKTGESGELVKEWILNETWFDASEALDVGLCDKILDEVDESKREIRNVLDINFGDDFPFEAHLEDESNEIF